MNEEKEESISIQKMRKMLLNIGLIISLMLTITAFEWSFDGVNFEMKAPEEMEDILESFPIVTIIETSKPPKPIIEKLRKEQPSIEIEIVPDEVFVEDKKTVLFIVDTIEAIISSSDVSDEKTDEIFRIVETSAKPYGGMSAFRIHLAKYLAKNYPERAQMAGISGTVYIEFYVDKDGSTKKFKVLKGIGGGCDREAIKAIKAYGKWSPPKQRGRAVRQWFNISVNFNERR